MKNCVQSAKISREEMKEFSKAKNEKFVKTIDGKVEKDMCKGMEEYTRRTEIIGAIKIMKFKGETDDSIVKTIVDFYKVTEEYVRVLM